MEITVTCHPWSLKITILGTSRCLEKWVRINRYAGDVGDFGKFSLLLAITVVGSDNKKYAIGVSDD
ncbi:MAG: hypothetical protein ACI9VT_002563 [Psychroserpens sp.]|jgi:hypothetical protein